MNACRAPKFGGQWRPLYWREEQCIIWFTTCMSGKNSLFLKQKVSLLNTNNNEISHIVLSWRIVSTVIIILQEDCRFWYERVYFFLPSTLDNTRGETQIILCWHPSRAANLVVSKVSTHLCRSKPKLILSDQIRKTQLFPKTAVPPLSVSFKILKFSAHPFRA